MLTFLIGLTSLVGGVFTICFIVWLVALLTNKKEVISRAGKGTLISLIVLLFSLFCVYGYISARQDDTDYDVTTTEAEDEKQASEVQDFYLHLHDNDK